MHVLVGSVKQGKRETVRVFVKFGKICALSAVRNDLLIDNFVIHIILQ